MAAKRIAIPKNILFVGNSFTARNDLIGMIHRMAAESGHKFEHSFINRGGASLRMHWNAGAAVAAIRSEKFDTVVLQEQSTLPVKNAARMRENILLFNDTIGAADCRLALYMTWARRNARAEGYHRCLLNHRQRDRGHRSSCSRNTFLRSTRERASKASPTSRPAIHSRREKTDSSN